MDRFAAGQILQIAGKRLIRINVNFGVYRKNDPLWPKKLRREKAIAMMEKHLTLIKRPAIEAGGEITVGWMKGVKAKLLQ